MRQKHQCFYNKIKLVDAKKWIFTLAFKKNAVLPWRRGVVVIVAATETKDCWFEYRQSVSVYDLINCNAVLCNLIPIIIVCM
jgi:hypothetical protein